MLYNKWMLQIAFLSATQACSPIRTKNCKDVHYTPGYCYTSITEAEWEQDRHSLSFGEQREQL